MVSITKLYLILRKKLLFVSVFTLRKSEELSHNIRYNRGNTHGFLELYALLFARKQTSILTLQLSVLLPCIRQQIKGEQSDEIRHSSVINSRPHEVKYTEMQCILTTNNKQMSWRKNEEEDRMPDLRLGNVFQLPSRRISRGWTRSGINLVIFLLALCAQTNLFWREMKSSNS